MKTILANSSLVGLYLVRLPCTHGKTGEDAICSGEEVIEIYLEACQAEGESIREPSTLQIA